MAVIAQSAAGWLLDSMQDINSHYSTEETPPYQCLQDLFEIWEPFMMDSQFEKLQNMGSPMPTNRVDDSDVSTKDTNILTRKRKRKSRANEAEERMREYHREVTALIEPTVKELLELGRLVGHFTIDAPLTRENNRRARIAALRGPTVDSSELCRRDKTLKDTYILETRDERLPDDLTNRLVEYRGDEPRAVEWLGDQYLLPGRSRFVLSDISRLSQCISPEEKFDFIVVDPPWENKSVKRRKEFATLSDWDLYRLPINQLAAPGAVIVCWATNRLRQINFVKNSLLPYWGVEYVADWRWVKVTRCGELVSPLYSQQKKPYENLIVGRVVRDAGNKESNPAAEVVVGDHPCSDTVANVWSDDASSVRSTNASSRALEARTFCTSVTGLTGDSREDTGGSIVGDDGDARVVLSVPCSVHSRKPTLQNVMKKYLPNDARCLEMFARGLLPDWTSWGNEVLCLQHLGYFRRPIDDHAGAAGDID